VTELDTSHAARGARRRERTRTLVLDAVERMLADRSPDSIRIEDVAAEAGVSPASVYVHFGTKDGLVAATVERLAEYVRDALRTAYAAGSTPFGQFQQAGVAYIRLLLDHPALTRYLAGGGISGLESSAEQTLSERIAPLREEFEQRIRAAIDAGEMIPTDARRLSYFLLGAWGGVASLALRDDAVALDAAEVERAVLEASSALVVGLTAP